LRKLHDLSDVTRAVSVATKLAVEQIEEIEKMIVDAGDHVEEATHDQHNKLAISASGKFNRRWALGVPKIPGRSEKPASGVPIGSARGTTEKNTGERAAMTRGH
jgi:hypothetical protein